MVFRKIIFVSFLLINCHLYIHAQATEKPNVIFIIFDDLNDYTESLGGHPQAVTPGISEIEALGTTFTNAYTNSPKCAPSRTSFLAGKDLAYTQVYKNPACKPFREYFKPGLGNEEVFILPEYMKEQGGYFTYGINKIFHCFDSEYDFDSLTADPCAKSLSWNKYSLFIDGEDATVQDIGSANNAGVKSAAWTPVSDTLEKYMYDTRAIDSATLFIGDVAADASITCGNPFFLMLGLRRPHLPWYIPEKYFMEDYVEDFYAEPFDYPYNSPLNSYPPTGVIMPPQPDTVLNDFYKLGELGKYFAQYDSVYAAIEYEAEHLEPLPEIDPLLTDDIRLDILEQTISANAVIAYIASIKYIDAQIKRLLDSLALYPEIYSNTIIVAISDNGFSLGEKSHWLKGAFWETDMRVPFVIADLRNPQQQVVNSTVSLLDIFPTLCDITETPMPTFEDGTDYLDGTSLLPLIEDPSILIEKPMLGSYEQHETEQCSCFPQFSIRNNRFHYIKYTSNNEADVLECNEELAYNESELYEVGANRETDPNEWNNLIGDSAYQPVVHYLTQWLPDSSMYLQKTFYANIQVNEMNCFANQNDTLQLSFLLYDTSGAFISPPADVIYLWTNNLSGDSLYGTAAEFPLSSINADLFANNSRLMIFMQMIDTSTGIVRAIDLKYIYLNDGNTPEATFNVINIGPLTIRIDDYELSGSHTSAWWDFGDGHISYDAVPGPYTYAEPGTYIVTHYVMYGNEDCIATYTTTITLENVDLDSNPDITYFPNPVSTTLNLSIPKEINFAEIRIFDLLGRLVSMYDYRCEGCLFYCEVNVADLRPGVYILTIQNDETTFEAPFVVAH